MWRRKVFNWNTFKFLMNLAPNESKEIDFYWVLFICSVFLSNSHSSRASTNWIDKSPKIHPMANHEQINRGGTCSWWLSCCGLLRRRGAFGYLLEAFWAIRTPKCYLHLTEFLALVGYILELSFAFGVKVASVFQRFIDEMTECCWGWWRQTDRQTWTLRWKTYWFNVAKRIHCCVWVV